MGDTSIETYQAVAISLGLGLLVGLQREWKESDIAGIRTFPLITLLGTLSALISVDRGHWVIAAGVLAVAVLLMVANLSKAKADRQEFGMTTEVAALLMYLVGAAIGLGIVGPSIVIGGIVAVLLHWKQPLHGFVARLGEKDLRAVIHLALIALVILPVLPDETYGPYDVLNPYEIWRMVVLIVGISMAAYVANKLLGTRVGMVLGGILGGLISSTATTVSYARRCKENVDIAPLAALVILIASTIVNARVLLEIGVVAPKLLPSATLPLVIMMGVMAVECLVLFIPLRHEDIKLPEHENPAQLKAAVVFGALYAVILFVVAAAKSHFGEEALYGIAMISGLTDVDAITLSTAGLFNKGQISSTMAWQVILIATMSNLVFKAGAVAALGGRRIFLYVGFTFAIAIATGVALLLYWPGIEIAIPPTLN